METSVLITPFKAKRGKGSYEATLQGLRHEAKASHYISKSKELNNKIA